MKIGILKEIKSQENRVSMTPAGVEQLVMHGHTVLVEHDAGKGSCFSDEEYKHAGGIIVQTPSEIFAQAEMVMHVKEILPSEYHLLRPGQIVFTYLHLAADLEQTKALMESKCVAIAYETVETNGRLPLLQPMSEVAGRMAIQEAARFLEMAHGGSGLLLGGVPGVPPAKVMIIGGGIVGINAAKMACGLGADVTIFDINIDRLRYLSDVMPANCKLIMYSPMTIREEIKTADVVIGAVLIAGAKAPRLVTRDMIATMKNGSVMVDVAIDQGGCFETSHPTTHTDPVFVIDGVTQYCVANMPGAVPRTSTIALTNATLPYALAIAEKGWKQALKEDPALAKGLNVCDGKLVYKPVAEALGLPYEAFA
ncbi:MAG: alanine dehydrogenase [Dysgonamonadaceae bacterium]|jgi:alanine dehydrogenase|nr:alanine dehydrogenase [Dysgonamonadaceae bacterium]